MAIPLKADDIARRQTPSQRLVEVTLILLMFFAIAGDPPPHVNEAHYLCRLKHYWNPEWCAGDLFLESRDAQLVFVWSFGWVTRFLSLPATAWVGRFIAWTLLAWAWQRLSWRLLPVPLAAVLSAALFVTLNERAHLAGEWIVGGVEAKCFAYAFVLLALTELLERASTRGEPAGLSRRDKPGGSPLVNSTPRLNRRWNRMWLLLGAATAFHPVVGGWSAVVCGGIWLWDFRRAPALRLALPGLAGFAILASFGVVPALMLTWNESAETVAEASRIYVFERLPHHLALLTLPSDEIARRLVRHGALLAAVWGLVRAWGATGFASASSEPQPGSQNTLAKPVAPISCVAQFAWAAALLAVIGFAIELALWNQPLVAARLLRYYWFRLTDFAAPLAAALFLTALVATGIARRRAWAGWLVMGVLLVAGWHIANIARARVLNPVPPADAKVRDYAAWVEACEWVAENTPPDALFLTPRLNHTFKWRAGRPEVVNRKDIPQDARSIVEWHRRIKDIYYTEIAGVEEPLDSIGILGTERVRELAIKYRADFVLMDRGQLLSLPREFWNQEYVVYRIQDRTGTGGQ
ncbi:MAG: DUF6798 domain-containing protein [Pirellulales bacterium]